MSTSALFACFWACLGVTVVLLGTALLLAKTHRARAHIGTIAGFVAALLVTLGFAEALGERFDFASTPKWIHLSLAVTTTVALFAPLVTGWRHWTGRGALEAHKVCAGGFLVLVVATLSTGVWMLSTRTPKGAASTGPVAAETSVG